MIIPDDCIKIGCKKWSRGRDYDGHGEYVCYIPSELCPLKTEGEQ